MLALGLDMSRRRTVLELLDRVEDTRGIHVLELAPTFEDEPEPRREVTRTDRRIPWPCSTEQLKQQINIANGSSAVRRDHPVREPIAASSATHSRVRLLHGDGDLSGAALRFGDQVQDTQL